MDDINRIIKSLEDSGILTDGVTETVRHEVGFHGTISAPMLQWYNLVVESIAGRGVMAVVRA